MTLPPTDASSGRSVPKPTDPAATNPATTDPATTGPVAVVDAATLADLKELMAEDFGGFMRDALARTTALLDELAAAVQAQDAHLVYQRAHRLQGGAAQLGAIGLAVQARQLAALGASAVLTGADARLTLARAQFARYRAAVHESIDELP